MANILVVDDSVSMRSMVSFTLKSEGYQTVEAANGQEALDQTQKSKFVREKMVNIRQLRNT